MGTTPALAPASASEAIEMMHAGLGYLAAADAAQLGAETQARCLRALEQAAAAVTAARASVLAAFTAGRGYCADADYSPRAWLMHKTGITKGAAVCDMAWARRLAGDSAGGGGAGRKGDVGVLRPRHLPVDGQAARRVPPAADAILVTAARAAWTCGTWPPWPRSCMSGPGRMPRMRIRAGV